jgi:hypothetical protein
MPDNTELRCGVADRDGGLPAADSLWYLRRRTGYGGLEAYADKAVAVSK